MHPSRNIAMLKENVQKPAASFEHYKQTTRMTMAEYKNIQDATMFVEEEEIKVAGIKRKVRRLYVKPEHSDFVGVGWIINEDIMNCMVCGESFGMFRWPHHCRSCGNLVCHPCSPDTVTIVELESLGEVRVCVQCYWGQSPVHAMHVRKAPPEEEEEEYEEEYEEEKVDSQNITSSGEPISEPVREVSQQKRPSLKPKPEEEDESEEEDPFTNRPTDHDNEYKVTPLPRFCVYATRKLSPRESQVANVRIIFINVCVHDVLSENAPEDVEFVISDDIYVFKPKAPKGKNVDQQTYEVYHVLLKPELLTEEALQEDEEQCHQAAEAILISLSEKFEYKMSKNFQVIHSESYVGDKLHSISVNESAEPFVYNVAASEELLAKFAQIADDMEKKTIAALTPPAPLPAPLVHSTSMKTSEFGSNPMARSPRRTTSDLDVKKQAVDKAEEEERQRKAKEKEEEVKRKQAEAEADAFSAAIVAQQSKSAEERLAAEKAAAEEKDRQRKLAAEEEARRKAADDAVKRTAAEKAANEERERQRKIAADAEAKRIAEKAAADEKERQRKAAEEENKRKAAAEAEAKRLAAEKAAAEEMERQQKRAAEEEAQRKAVAAKAAAEKAAAEEKQQHSTAASTAIGDSITSKSVDLVSEKITPAAAAALTVPEKSENPPSARPSSIAEFEDSIATLFIPSVTFEPIPGAVIKTKREDGTKIFVNVCHHALIPLFEASNPHLSHPFYPDYLQLNFTQFTLNKARYVMHVGLLRETADKEGGTCFVSDIVVHSSVFAECSKDMDLCDKFYLKVLKALARYNNTDFDADYKLPKIMKNYKGNDVTRVTMESYSSVGRPLPQQDSSRNSFRYFRASDITPASTASKLFGEAATPVAPPVPPRPSQTSSFPTNTYTPAKPSSPFPINEEWNRKWKSVITPGTNVVYTSVITKKNSYGMNKTRQLILTDEPQLIYVEASSMSVKGNVTWEKNNPPKAIVVDKSTFTVGVPGREFKFVDLDGNATMWVQKINAVVTFTRTPK